MLKKLVLVLILLLFTISLASAELYEIGQFENCSDYTFYVEITSLGKMYEGTYGLDFCETIIANEYNHVWRCDCNRSLNLTLDTIAAIDDTYSASVVRVLKGTDYETVKSYQKEDNLKIVPATVDVKPTSNEITGRVASLTGSDSLTTIGIVGLMVLVFLLVISFNMHGGMPWESKTSRAKKFHKRGRKAYELGNNSKAKKCYEKSAKLRDKS